MIRFDHVTKSYSGTTRPALNDVTLEILGGEFVFLVGASGSGKSSFLRLVLKEERATRGDVYVLGRHLNTLANRKVPFFRRSLGVVFQDFRLLPQKTVFDNVAFTLQVIGKSKGFIQEAVPDVLRLVGLAGKEGRLPHELSGGEQQRVAIARAVVNKPAILLADEPTGNLDPATSAGIMNLLSTINANGTTVLMATHDVGIVDQMRRRVIELVGGNVVRDERSGGYQTQAIPVQRPSEESPAPDASAPAPGPTESITLAANAPSAMGETPIASRFAPASPTAEPSIVPEPEVATAAIRSFFAPSEPAAEEPVDTPQFLAEEPAEPETESTGPQVSVVGQHAQTEPDEATVFVRRGSYRALLGEDDVPSAPAEESGEDTTPPPLNEPGGRW